MPVYAPQHRARLEVRIRNGDDENVEMRSSRVRVVWQALASRSNLQRTRVSTPEADANLAEPTRLANVAASDNEPG